MVGVAGDAELVAAVDESNNCADQMTLESVRQDPQLMQFWLDRHRVICKRLFQAAREGTLVLPAAQPSGHALCTGMGNVGWRHAAHRSAVKACCSLVVSMIF